MDWNETLEKTLAQARDLQRQMNEAANKAAEDMKPHLERSLKQAQDLQATLSKHATESSAMASQQSQVAMGHLNEFIRVGNQAMRESAEQTRATAQKMTDQAQKVVDATAEAVKRNQTRDKMPED
ncbi:MAG: hypothetical protein GIW95_03805 [Candidatus Eremiobacteraeota bacterium]|nr:hypothetical protein [Candidatus Eremiobacteraeota bacterium]